MESLTLSDIDAGSLIYVRPGHVEVFKGRRISKSHQKIIYIKKISENSLDEANKKKHGVHEHFGANPQQYRKYTGSIKGRRGQKH